MKKYSFFQGTIALLLALLLQPLSLSADEIQDTLASLPGITNVQPLPSTVYKHKYVMQIRQWVDPHHASAGTFLQRVIVAHVGFDRPTVLVTEGYDCNYALRPGYQEELSKLLNANLVFVEYRYFDKSRPNPCNWQYLTVENSLYDLHNVNVTLHKLYHGPWAATGISKGGQTCMFYRVYFPNDVAVSVPYVAPLNRGVEDGRHQPFLEKQVGTAAQRDSLLRYQITLLKHKPQVLPMFTDYCNSKHYTFRVPLSDIYDYCVLEYPFAMWQWGTPLSTMPGENASDSAIFKNLIEVNEPDYFSEQTPYLPFNVQAARELGYYGYDIKPLKKYIGIKSARNYLHRVMLPQEFDTIKFSKKLYHRTIAFLKHNDPTMVYIYGGIDPWGASGVAHLKFLQKKKKLKVYMLPQGSHRTRINSFPEAERQQIISTINSYLYGTDNNQNNQK